ncbi:MAG TPA: prepilin-type N-terminal cleavage/methylation domain-containing protein [Burkholderiales bacterium]|jgi:prepilin-type N-terminal cleavage/methylation domain-containing protein|nr:prepilin-type N-terminal cleavage/methylation domain-containing protein [Burkholderiales bacterium]
MTTASAYNGRDSNEAGFTLVEIAIVLVIIGLLLGGILKGQEMITQAKIKNVINDFNGVTTAVTSYQDRYRALPGDDPNATTRWTTQAPASGNGNGILAGLYNANDTTGSGGAPAAAAESNLFWQHLRIAGFVPGLTVGTGSGTPPQNATGGIIGAESAVVGTNGLGFTALIVCTSNVPDKVAIAVDTQTDDSNSATGQVRAQLQTTANPATAASPATGYVETGVNQYLLCKNY